MQLRKYTKEQVIKEADLFLTRNWTLKQVSRHLGIPHSTVSWHLIFVLRELNYDKWVQVRTRLHCYARNAIRAQEELKYLMQEDKNEDKETNNHTL